MPIYHLTLRSKKPVAEAYPASLIAVGDHLRKRRLDLGLLQREAAEAIGVSENTVYNWEKHRVEPGIREWRGIIRFLGYLPFEVGSSAADVIRAYRMVEGLSQRGLASRLGRDESTVRAWEARRSVPPEAFVREARAVVDRFIHTKSPR